MSLPEQLHRRGEGPTAGQCTGGHITAEARVRFHWIEQALSDIASGSPAVTHPGTENERQCSLCLAHINHARDAMGYDRWPAVPGTRKGSHGQP